MREVARDRVVFGIDLAHAVEFVIHDRQREPLRPRLIIHERRARAVRHRYDATYVGAARDFRKSSHQPLVQLIHVEMRIRRARTHRVGTLARSHRDAAIVDRAQPNVALADIENDNGLRTLFGHPLTIPQSPVN